MAVHRDGHVVYKHALYSAPFTLVGKSLWLKATDTVIQLFHRHELVATHPRQRAGGRHTVRDHQPPEAQAWLEHDPQWCLARAKEIGPSCHGVILALFNDKVLVNLRGAQGSSGCDRKSAIRGWKQPASVRSRSAARSTAPSRASSTKAWTANRCRVPRRPRLALTRTAAASAVISNPC
ncbi:Mu transposase domain-containing protein [Burkholderia lata]|uniref:Mu transposase domain-containing protein n=1 Tax=Burkholderia lata (strain ATCC 17760 / DSM 23089 / LMG 22485 / NCIMB 9086 / R18194 / 383) TaxID=482957 RepID=UPI001F0BAD7C|nr:hypothetical protein [Burkholderia lata]